MVAAIRQTVTVGAGGRVEVQVIVLVEQAAAPKAPVAAFEQLQQGLNLDAARAAEWSNRVREERQSFGPRE